MATSKNVHVDITYIVFSCAQKLRSGARIHQKQVSETKQRLRTVNQKLKISQFECTGLASALVTKNSQFQAMALKFEKLQREVKILSSHLISFPVCKLISRWQSVTLNAYYIHCQWSSSKDIVFLSYSLCLPCFGELLCAVPHNREYSSNHVLFV